MGTSSRKSSHRARTQKLHSFPLTVLVPLSGTRRRYFFIQAIRMEASRHPLFVLQNERRKPNMRSWNIFTQRNKSPPPSMRHQNRLRYSPAKYELLRNFLKVKWCGGTFLLFKYDSRQCGAHAFPIRSFGAKRPNAGPPIHPVSTTDQVSGNVKQASKPWQIQQIFQKPLLSKQQLRHHNELIKQTAKKNAQGLNREKRTQLIITFSCVCVTRLQLRRLDKAICPLGKCVQSLLTVQRNTIRQWCWFVGNLMSARSLHEAVRVGPTSLTAAITPYEPVSAQTSISGPLGAVGRLWCSV